MRKVTVFKHKTTQLTDIVGSIFFIAGQIDSTCFGFRFGFSLIFQSCGSNLVTLLKKKNVHNIVSDGNFYIWLKMSIYIFSFFYI